MSSSSNPPGEPDGPPFSAAEKRFLVEVAHKHLDGVADNDTLKHFADLWWNLCGWESARAAVLDGKAQGLLTLASIVGAVVTVSAALGGDQVAGAFWRALAIFLFVLAAFAAVWALRVRDHGGFLDRGVFEALSYNGDAADWFPAFADKDRFRLYLREVAMQRWSVYRSFKQASAEKGRRVSFAQNLALAGALVLAISVIVQMHAARKALPDRGSSATQSQVDRAGAALPVASGASR